MATIFTRIIDGELPGHFVWKDDVCVGFLSINPLRPGHALIVPRAEVDHWLDADPELRSRLFTVAHAVGSALEKVYQPEKVGIMLAGLEVPHAHVHVLPIWEVHDLDFSKAAQNVSPDELAAEATKIRSALRELGFSEASD